MAQNHSQCASSIPYSPNQRVERTRRCLVLARFPGAPWIVSIWKAMQSPGLQVIQSVGFWLFERTIHMHKRWIPLLPICWSPNVRHQCRPPVRLRRHLPASRYLLWWYSLSLMRSNVVGTFYPTDESRGQIAVSFPPQSRPRVSTSCNSIPHIRLSSYQCYTRPL